MSAPYDLDVEEALLGVCLCSGDAVRYAIDTLRPEDFFKPSHAHIFEAFAALHAAGSLVNPVTVAAALRQSGYDVVKAADLISLVANAPASAGVKRYAEIVQRHAYGRSALARVTHAYEALSTAAGDPAAAVEALQADLLEIDSPHVALTPRDVSVRELLSEAPDKVPWAIPGLLHEDDRAFMVGLEGTGKTELFRQVAICAAYGMHPFTLAPLLMEPIPTLIVDLENPRRNIFDRVGAVHAIAERFTGSSAGADRCRVWIEPAGIELRNRRWRAHFEDILRRHRPKLVVLGPLYKAWEPVEREDHATTARTLQVVLDDLRTRFGFALIVEHHPGNEQRDAKTMRPEGSVLWRRWPELRWKLFPVEPEPPYRKPLDEFPVRAIRRSPFAGDRVLHSWPDAIFRGRFPDLPWLGYWDTGNEPPHGPEQEEMF